MVGLIVLFNVVIDPDGAVIREVKPAAVVDGILAKKNLGTTMDMAPFKIGRAHV